MTTRFLILFTCIHYYVLVPLEASIIAKSSISQCSDNDVHGNDGQPCGKMLVVALTVTGNEVCILCNILTSKCSFSVFERVKLNS